MPNRIAQKLAKRFRRTPEPDEVAIVLANDLGGSVDVDPGKTNLRSPQGTGGGGGLKLGGKTHAFPMHDNRDRIGAYREYRRLDANLPEAGAALDVIATSAIGGEPGSEILGFDIEYAAEFPEADRDFVDRLIDRLGLRQLVKPIVRSNNMMGDVFFHVIVDGMGRLLKLKHLEPELTYAVLDRFGEIVGWEYRGYEDGERLLLRWEVIHLAHLPDLGAIYGRAIFASGLRPTGFALQGMRDSAMVQVVKNASGQVAMIFGVPSGMDPNEKLAKLEEMYELTARAPVMIDGKLDRRVIESMNEQPLILTYDVMPNGTSAKPEVKQLAATDLGGVVEILENFQDQFVIPLKVPKAQMGIERSGEGVGGNRLTTQAIEFAKYLNSEQHDIVWFIHRVIALAYWLIGRPLKADMFEIVMADLAFMDTAVRADIRKVAMETAKMAVEIGMPFSYIWTEILWDGDTQTAVEMADKYGVSLDSEPDPVVSTGEDPPDEEAVEEAKGKLARHLASDLEKIKQAAALVEGVRSKNEPV